MPYPPMEATQVEELPEGAAWQYEPKWDGFRCLAFRDGDEVVLQSKSCHPLGRYFPEVVGALASLPARRFVLDGELVIPVGDRLSFEELLLRVHPAESRVRRLAREHPALLVAFDVLVGERGELLAERPLADRRRSLEGFATRRLHGPDVRVRLSPVTHDPWLAQRWLSAGGGGLDGVVAKRLDLPYRSGLRDGMVKVKRLRTAECVVGGFRYATQGRRIGSLLLGLYDEEGRLNHVGFASGLRADEREALTPRLQALVRPPGFTGRAPGGPSRWASERSGKWEPLAPELVVEVEYDHFTGGRFRHGVRLLRWRPDKAPRQCTFAQIPDAAKHTLTLLSSSAG